MTQAAASVSRHLRFALVVRPGHPDFLDLPWQLPLGRWRSERLVEVERGIHRHVVRFVEPLDQVTVVPALRGSRR